ncbi:MAG: radical SAM family heme chaperone HemW [Bacteroidales bacterium]
MPGIYIHIPFCRQACHYCNFHFSISQKRRPEFVEALLKEIELQRAFFNPEPTGKTVLDTLYFGGGTPSLLSIGELRRIYDHIQMYFELSPDAEVTLEANPDDLDARQLAQLKALGVNRLSIGIQSFREEDLLYMNRSHTAAQAFKVLDDALDCGFSNITADLIYGTPGMTDQHWHDNLMQLVSRGIPHISAYALTVEKRTALDVFIRQGKAAPVDDEMAAQQFDHMCRLLANHQYDHYEISNFGKEGFYSQHNLGYWSGEPYLGLGPSAHSFVPGFRRWNVANTCRYIDSLSQGIIPFEQEVLSREQQFNEYVMTALRTLWGIEKQHVLNHFGEQCLEDLVRNAQVFIAKDQLTENATHLKLKPNAKFFADGIASHLFVV